MATAALAELVGDVVLPGGDAPATTASRTVGGWRLEGTKACVPAGLVADLVLVPATVVSSDGEPGGLGVFLVETSAKGLTRTRQDGAALPEALVELSGVEVGDDSLLGAGAGGAAVVAFVTDHATAALCVLEAGACATALALTGRVRQDPRAVRQAHRHLPGGRPAGRRRLCRRRGRAAHCLAGGLEALGGAAGRPELAVAKFWAAEGGQRVVHAAAHIHGGVGVDRDYPLHRFFLLTEQIESLGGARQSLARLGAVLAADPA